MDNEFIYPEYNGDYLISQDVYHRPYVASQKTTVYTLEDYQKAMDNVLPFVHAVYKDDPLIHGEIDISLEMSRFGGYNYVLGTSQYLNVEPGKKQYTLFIYNRLRKTSIHHSSFNRKEFYDFLCAFLFFIQKYNKQEGHVFKFGTRHVMQEDDGQREVNERLASYKEFDKMKAPYHIDYIKKYTHTYLKPELKNPFLDSPL